MLTGIGVIFDEVSQTVLIALRALRRNKLRSALTALGIIIGVASVVAMIAVGNGAQVQITSKVSSLGQNLLIVFAGNRRTAGMNGGAGSASTLTLADARAIQQEIPEVDKVSPEVSTAGQSLAMGRNWYTSIVGESADYPQIRRWQMQEGAMFTERDVRAAAKVAVIGTKAAHELFGPLDPMGQTVRIKDIPFMIVGVLQSKGAGFGGQNTDDRILIPYSTVMKRITGDRYLRVINVAIANANRIDQAQKAITDLLRQRHNLSLGMDDDFGIFSQKEIADTVGNITSLITLLLGAIAGLSLIVGGIGIMNIMLVSVTERTREIGIRIAVGAQPSAIKLQFLVEATTLSVLGGLIGLLVAIAASQVVAALTELKPIVSIGSILLAFGVSGVIGISFGYLPARKAAALDPIEALRYE